VLVMSSREEGLGSVVLHALALGTPVVATRGGGLPEMLPAQALVDVGDAEGLARKVADVVSNAQSTLRHPHFPARFTSRAMAEGVLAVYRDLV
jgi:glycosyltransferase involved in cell wall biosynthesis